MLCGYIMCEIVQGIRTCFIFYVTRFKYSFIHSFFILVDHHVHKKGHSEEVMLASEKRKTRHNDKVVKTCEYNGERIC